MSLSVPSHPLFILPQESRRIGLSSVARNRIVDATRCCLNNHQTSCPISLATAVCLPCLGLARTSRHIGLAHAAHTWSDQLLHNRQSAEHPRRRLAPSRISLISGASSTSVRKASLSTTVDSCRSLNLFIPKEKGCLLLGFVTSRRSAYLFFFLFTRNRLSSSKRAIATQDVSNRRPRWECLSVEPPSKHPLNGLLTLPVLPLRELPKLQHPNLQV